MTDFRRPGRAQAAPLAAWLRIPFDWYHSTTYAYYDNESHSSIKKTYHTPSPPHSLLPPTRRQFCGYCGTTLTAWNEGTHASGHGSTSLDYLDVTLGSLLDESLDQLEALRILPADVDSDESEGELQGTAAGMRDTSLEELPSAGASVPRTLSQAGESHSIHRMSDRGMPFFEELIENSRLGRIRRQRGGQTARDGSSTIQWEVIETIIGSDESPASTGHASSPNKRQRLD